MNTKFLGSKIRNLINYKDMQKEKQKISLVYKIYVMIDLEELSAMKPNKNYDNKITNTRDYQS